ncbi:hypothetical protein K439DRAFT_1363506, partial [Ramaria rubella]
MAPCFAPPPTPRTTPPRPPIHIRTYAMPPPPHCTCVMPRPTYSHAGPNTMSHRPSGPPRDPTTMHRQSPPLLHHHPA